eukprot:CAMPEP_0197645240 /NCGR_PEP_ID=MMETSP1338-20131121/18219_1 /TAXON_ID=43686 ORGANISM="Pelagodinium beii, Strain RCC1491" /NCGR_SAMPLE_ID=MMETSP1338 /ASSEMBLY_ACC=CAM_ASM_000754 /LENGTH=45 /DNA_ID= /DNA_START= /DNA_END= /DNA_ORIENTATION=
MAELHLSSEAGGTSADAPSNNGLGDAALLHSINEVVLIKTAHFAQ